MISILDTDPIFAFIFLRLGLAAVFFAHASQQVFGWFGGKGRFVVFGRDREEELAVEDELTKRLFRRN